MPQKSVGISANRPSSPLAGDEYTATDTGVKSTCLSPGSWTDDPPNLESGGGRIFKSALAEGSTFLLISATAYWVYLGKTKINLTPKYVEFAVTTGGSGAQTAEVGLFSTPNPPNKTAQTLTKLVATGTVDDLTTTGIKRNTSAFSTQIAAGTHLWAGIRTALASSQPTLRGLQDDWAQGHLLVLAGAGVLTGTTFAGGLGAGGTQILCPALRATLD